ncbi:MAG: tRNA (adenosine(37)-N6)-threonylcarbamoyltransferase complex transferase subunit TsaD [Caldisericia bacterium]
MKILGIETSCDDTSFGIVENGKLISMVRSTSEDFHKKYGGIVPEIAARKQLEVFTYLLDDLVEKTNINLNDIDGFSVTIGPGLVGSLLVGVEVARTLSYSLKKPLIGVNHLEGHIYSIFFDHKIEFPFQTLIISGGHTILLIFEDHLKYKILGETVDDACGEIIDKIGRKLNFPYPAGRVLDEIALKGDPLYYKFSTPRFKEKEKKYNFSFSGIKTEVLNIIKKGNFNLENLISSLFYTIFDSLFKNIKKVYDNTGIKKVSVVGGVSASKFLRNMFLKEKDYDFYFPSYEFSTDNGGMIAIVGEEYLKRGYESNIFEIDAVSSLELNNNPYILKKSGGVYG